MTCSVRGCDLDAEPFRLLLPWQGGDVVFEIAACRLHRSSLTAVKGVVTEIMLRGLWTELGEPMPMVLAW